MEFMSTLCLSQYACISFLSGVVLLILKKISFPSCVVVRWFRPVLRQFRSASSIDSHRIKHFRFYPSHAKRTWLFTLRLMCSDASGFSSLGCAADGVGAAPSMLELLPDLPEACSGPRTTFTSPLEAPKTAKVRLQRREVTGCAVDFSRVLRGRPTGSIPHRPGRNPGPSRSKGRVERETPPKRTRRRGGRGGAAQNPPLPAGFSGSSSVLDRPRRDRFQTPLRGRGDGPVRFTTNFTTPWRDGPFLSSRSGLVRDPSVSKTVPSGQLLSCPHGIGGRNEAMDDDGSARLVSEAVFGDVEAHLEDAREAIQKHGGNADLAAAELMGARKNLAVPKRATQTRLCFAVPTKRKMDAPDVEQRRNSTEEKSSLVDCPQCGRRVPLLTINVHLDTCGLVLPKRLKTNPTAPGQDAVEGDHGCKTLLGHHVFMNFITEQEETDLLHWIDTCSPPWKVLRINGRHHGKKWGHFVNLRDRKVTLGDGPLPEPLLRLVKRMRQSIPFLEMFLATDANAIEYIPTHGHELLPHVDDRQLTKDTLVNLSLAGDCIMTFQREGTSSQELRREVLLPRRSLQVLQKDARYTYTHAIKNEHLLSSRRVSVTFRDSPVTEQPMRKPIAP